MSNIFCAKWCIHASKFWIICTGEQGYANTGANLKELQRYLSYQIFRYSISTLLRLKSRNNHLKCLQIFSQSILNTVICIVYDGHSIKCDRRRKQIAALVLMLLWRGGPRTQYTGPPSRFTAPRPIGGRWSQCHTLLALRHSAHISGTLLYNEHHNNTRFISSLFPIPHVLIFYLFRSEACILTVRDLPCRNYPSLFVWRRNTGWKNLNNILWTVIHCSSLA